MYLEHICSLKEGLPFVVTVIIKGGGGDYKYWFGS